MRDSLLTCWMILRLLCPAARSSRLTIFLMLFCMFITILNCTSACSKAREISFKHSASTFSSMRVALLICWRAREMRPPSSASTMLACFSYPTLKFLQQGTLKLPKQKRQKKHTHTQTTQISKQLPKNKNSSTHTLPLYRSLRSV